MSQKKPTNPKFNTMWLYAFYIAIKIDIICKENKQIIT